MHLIRALQNAYIVEGNTLAHDAETCIGELMAALRKIADDYEISGNSARAIAVAAITKCAEGD
jgi:hypothetical protein